MPGRPHREELAQGRHLPAHGQTAHEQDVFPCCPELKDGYYWANDKPGLGIDLDEKLAAKFTIISVPCEQSIGVVLLLVIGYLPERG